MPGSIDGERMDLRQRGRACGMRALGPGHSKRTRLYERRSFGPVGMLAAGNGQVVRLRQRWSIRFMCVSARVNRQRVRLS